MYLTCQSDKLAAISGLTRELVNRTQKKPRYIAGLWKEVFITQLLWEYDEKAPKVAKARASAQQQHEPYRAPSFSWAYVSYPVWFTWYPKEKVFDDDDAVLVN
jgi:hypothetical protein